MLLHKKTSYPLLTEQLKHLIVPDITFEGNACNLLAQLKSELNLFWVGLYMVAEDGNLVLGAFQGLPACTKINIGNGVCGTAAQKKETVIVNDVSAFPGYIACHAEARSEIVLPGFKNGKLAFVLDVDSAELSAFDEDDKFYLQKIIHLFESILPA